MLLKKKIEKFSSQNLTNQKRVNTSSKFRNTPLIIQGTINNKGQISSKHGPGTSGGLGFTTGGLEISYNN